MAARSSEGKAGNLGYVAGAWWRMLLPRWVRRMQRRILLRGWERRPDAGHIRDRVDFYCRRAFDPEAGGDVAASEVTPRRYHSKYALDLGRYLRSWPGSARLCFFAGDVWENPPAPTLIKARRLGEGEDNGVLMKLNRRRHYRHPVDLVPFEEKRPILFFRGDIRYKPHRRRFLEMWSGSRLMDIGDTTPGEPSPWTKAPVPVPEQFRYRFILVLEGNDVATALQWVMASGCVPFMTKPTVETWLMHSRMVPGVHYVEIASDFSDVEEKVRYYAAHTDEARAISEASRRWAAMFDDRRREDIISHLVLAKYFGETV